MKIIRSIFILLPCVPFLGLFAPVTMMREHYHPWYIDYTSPMFLLSGLYYMPAGALAHAVTSSPGVSGDPAFIWLLYPACLLQSLILSLIIWVMFRSREAQIQMHTAPHVHDSDRNV